MLLYWLFQMLTSEASRTECVKLPNAGAAALTCSLVIPIQMAPPNGASATGHFQI